MAFIWKYSNKYSYEAKCKYLLIVKFAAPTENLAQL